MQIIEKRIYYIDLLHLYGDLLSSTQKAILTDYFDFDLSISEIAENNNITRAAVEDALKKGSKKLECYEGVIHLYQKKEIIMKNSAILREKVGNCEEIENIEEALK